MERIKVSTGPDLIPAYVRPTNETDQAPVFPFDVANNDPYNGNYINAMQTYHVPLANAGVVPPAHK